MSEARPRSNLKHLNNFSDPHGSRKLTESTSTTASGRELGGEIVIKKAGEEPKRGAAFSGHKTSGHLYGGGKKSRDGAKHLKYVAIAGKPVNQGAAHERGSGRGLRRHHQAHSRRRRRRRHRRRQRRPHSRRDHRRRLRAESRHLHPRAKLFSPTSSHVNIHKYSVAHMPPLTRTTDSSLPDGRPVPSVIARTLTKSAQPQFLAQTGSDHPNQPSGTAEDPFIYLLLVGLLLYACLMFALIICLVLKYCKNAKRAFRAKTCPETKKSPNKIRRFIRSPIGFISNGKVFHQSGGSKPPTEVVTSKFALGTSGATPLKSEPKKSLDRHQLTINMESSELSTEDSDSQQSRDRNGPVDSRVKAVKSRDNPTQLGRLKYSLEYDFNRNSLTVGIHEAYELAAMDQNGFSDPYVNVYMADNKSYPTYRTKIHKRTLNPVFNETFVYQISYVELAKQTLILSVYDYDKLTRHDEIGQLTLPMNSIDLTQRQVNCSELRKMNEAAEGRLGDICLSLRYVPTAGRLNVVVLEARQLKKMDVAGLSDPYVKLALVSQGKRLKKKKTSIKKCTLNPHFNESFSFEVPFDQAQKVQLVVTVVDYDRIGTSEPIGMITLGYEQATSDTEQRHWMDMLASPRRPIARWHTLKSINFDSKRPVLSRRLSKIVHN